MIAVTRQYFRPNLIAKLRFDSPKKCVEFEQALQSLLEKDWKKEWEDVMKIIHAEIGDSDNTYELFDIGKIIYFNEQISPMLQHILHLAENAVEVDDANVYNPVLCFLTSRYEESKDF